ncbi:MAG: GSCFA domain-containing protein [Actinobacteria bacterium]|nr:GSCFA domain-containing protein [Actinomycetota bacterium]
MSHPYAALPARSFWRTAVAEPAPADIDGLWTPKFALGQDDPILTVGSCFARHLGRTLLELGRNWQDAEPAPPGLRPEERTARQYGVFSFRTGNVYTAAMLRQWLAWAVGAEDPGIESWVADGRHFDPFRPSVEPAGHPDAGSMLAAREMTLAAVRRAFGDARCLIFTLGLTEAWHERATGAVYPVCPGTVRGTFDPGRHVFVNHDFARVREDLLAIADLAHGLNPELRILLTVSPVPLTATATGQHALTATTYSKSVLRAVAGQLAFEDDRFDYFPAYELITGAPFRAGFYEPNLRDVTADGVRFVMSRFAAGLAGAPSPERSGDPAARKGVDQFCDDAVLDYYNSR